MSDTVATQLTATERGQRWYEAHHGAGDAAFAMISAAETITSNTAPCASSSGQRYKPVDPAKRRPALTTQVETSSGFTR